MGQLTTQSHNEACKRFEDAYKLWGDHFSKLGDQDHKKIMPEKQCVAIIGIVDQVLIPASDMVTIDDLKQKAIRLTGSFADLGKHHKKTYLATIAEVLSEYPIATHDKAIKKLIRTCQHLPTIAEIDAALAEQKGRYMIAKLKAESDLKKHRRAQELKEREELLAKEREERDGKPLPGLTEILAGAVKTEYHCVECETIWTGEADSVCPNCGSEE